MAKIRIYELARELGTDNKTLESVIRGLGIEIKNYMSTLTPEQATVVRGKVGGGSVGAGSKPTPTASTGAAVRRKNVIRRRASGPRPAEKEKLEREKAELEAREREAEATPAPLRREPVRRVRREAAEPSGGRASERPAPAEPKPEPARAPVSADAPRGNKLPGQDTGGPQVGERIQLPPRTRRFEGGLAERMEREEKVRASVPTPTPRTPTPTPAAAPTPEPTPPKAEPKPEPAEPPAAAAEGATPAADSGAEARDRAVVRDDSGAIVGTERKRSGPQILGFIQLEPRRRQQVIITEASKPKQKGRASLRKKREEKAQQQQRRRNFGARGRHRRGDRSGPKASSTQEMSQEKKRIRVDEAIQVAELAHQMSVKAPKVIRVLWNMGMRGIMINNAIDVETAEMVAAEFGYTVENVSFQEDALVEEYDGTEGELRAPVVTVMGHVDHGKTTLLDTIRKASVADGEAGGITQHIGAYRVDSSAGPVVFVDTPGHQAFSAMRSRGASLTDIIVLIVSADDGVMPTTVEAISHAKEANVPVIVAINKIDKPEANPGRVKQMLMEHSLVGEEFGGDTPILLLSAKTGDGVPELLETLALQAELLDLRAPDEGRAAGVVVEARVDKGRGSVATLLVQSGTLNRGDIVVAGEASGRIRGVYTDNNEQINEAGPSMPVEVLGLDGAPPAGERFHVVESERDAKQIVSHRRDQRRRKESVKTGPSVFERIKAKKIPSLKIVLRADVQGSAEAVKETLENLSTHKVKVEVISSGVGAINETDVKLAHAGEAVIIGFNVKPVGKAAPTAEAEKVPIHLYGVIYEAAEKVEDLMVDLLEPEYVERERGEAEVRELFPIPRLGVVCGSRVIKGRITRDCRVRVKRDGRQVFEGPIHSLRVFKDDVKEVKEGFECGIVVDGFTEPQPGDVLEAYELETMRPSIH